tara:strand:+ start:70 stop:519 length:450 start_codon:yes stop_codon:yes gene_type:complete
MAVNEQQALDEVDKLRTYATTLIHAHDEYLESKRAGATTQGDKYDSLKQAVSKYKTQLNKLTGNSTTKRDKVLYELMQKYESFVEELNEVLRDWNHTAKLAIEYFDRYKAEKEAAAQSKPAATQRKSMFPFFGSAKSKRLAPVLHMIGW